MILEAPGRTDLEMPLKWLRLREAEFNVAIAFDEETHTYARRDNGVVLPSVTDIMWPLTMQAYGNIPLMNLQQAAERGTLLHNAVALHEMCGYAVVESRIAAHFENYLQWRDRFAYDGNTLLAVEFPVYNKYDDFCGTIDQIWFNEEGYLTIVDLKTSGKAQARTWAVQVALYAIALRSPVAPQVVRSVAWVTQKQASHMDLTSEEANDCAKYLIGLNRYMTT